MNLGEVWYRVARDHSVVRADQAVEAVRRLGFAVEPINWGLAKLAAALARQKRFPVVTGDPEFRL